RAGAGIEQRRRLPWKMACKQRQADRRMPVSGERHLMIIGSGPAVIERRDLLRALGLVDRAQDALMSGSLPGSVLSLCHQRLPVLLCPYNDSQGNESAKRPRRRK